MSHNDDASRTHECPSCGKSLTHLHGSLYCKEHGSFFIYSSLLLVRVPRPELNTFHKLLPWDVAQTIEPDINT